MPRPANSELVTVAFLKTMTGITNSMVATTVPEDESAWAATGFIQVVGTVGGTPDKYLPIHQPVVQLDLWAVNPSSKFPPWDKASDLGGLIYEGLLDMSLVGKALTLRAGYEQAKVMSAYAVTEARRVPGDAGARARYTMDVNLMWVSL